MIRDFPVLEGFVPNTYDLSGKTAVVTDAAKGVGRAIAELLLANGCSVTAWDANACEVPGAASTRVDITDAAQVAAALARYSSERLDILINNAGYLGSATERPVAASSRSPMHSAARSRSTTYS